MEFFGARSRQDVIGSGLFPGGRQASSWIVNMERTSNSLAPFGVVTVTVSPIFFPIKPRPIGEVVEIKPLLTSASSLVTSLYSTSASRSRS